MSALHLRGNLYSLPRFSFVDRDMFMRYLGGGAGHCTKHHEDPYPDGEDDDMWIDEDENVNASVASIAIGAEVDREPLDLDYDEVDDWSCDSDNSSGEDDLGPEDGEDEQEDEEADYDCYDTL